MNAVLPAAVRKEVERLAIESFGPGVIERFVALPAGDRGTVLRVSFNGSIGRRSAIAKVRTDGRQVRERAALAVCSKWGVRGVPRILAAVDNPSILLIEDLGVGKSLVDYLQARSPGPAESAVLDWARAVASLQAATLNAGNAFIQALREHSVLDTPSEDMSDDVVASAARDLCTFLPQLGVKPADNELEELLSLGKKLSRGSGMKALSPADTCPDNNVETDQGTALLDFEWAQYRHVAWDAAYLVVPWPSCWCAWRLPVDVSNRALETWRATLVPSLPMQHVADLDASVNAAVVVWCLVSTAWFLPKALMGDPRLPGRRNAMPARRSMIQDRMLRISTMPVSVPIQTLANRVLAASQREWGERHLELAPAWQ